MLGTLRLTTLHLVVYLDLDFLGGLPPPAQVFRIAAILRQYSGPRLAVCFPPLLPKRSSRRHKQICQQDGQQQSAVRMLAVTVLREGLQCGEYHALRLSCSAVSGDRSFCVSCRHSGSDNAATQAVAVIVQRTFRTLHRCL